jgi:HAE1 family hydrophobic/amphiphilic exporter-1
MNLSRIFIERPVMTTLVMAAIVIFGAFGYTQLPINDLPNMDLPTIQVFATLPGADPTTMASAVAAPLEAAFTQIAGVDSMTSSSGQGQTSIVLQFTLDRNIDSAAQDVQAAISGAARQLPRAMPAPPSFRKVNPSDVATMSIALSSDTMSPTKVDEYGETLLGRQLSTVEGVAQVLVYGGAKFAVRIQADPAALATRQIGIDQLVQAVAQSNVNQATGALNGDTRSQVIRADGQLSSADDFAHQVIAYRGGAPVRLGDVAHVVEGAENPFSLSYYRGKQAIVLQVFRQAGANTIKMVDGVNAILPKFQETLPPSIHMETIYDRSVMIRASVDDVQHTLMIAGLLVVGVIFVFLRRLRATLIPSLALPIAVVGTFSGMAALGYNLDNLSLMALTLSVGFVVDDAIVMLENIYRHIEMGQKPYEAAMKGAGEIGFTILSMTVSLAAVFIPIVFMGGVVGRLLHEFAVTIIVAIMFSGIISITLTPMLCARLLKDDHGEKHNAFYRLSENTFNRIHRSYQRSLAWSLNHKPFILGLFALSILASGLLFSVMQQDFLPSDDTGRITGQLQAANGTSVEQMKRYAQTVTAIIDTDPNTDGVMAQMQGSPGTAGINAARFQIRLKQRQELACWMTLYIGCTNGQRPGMRAASADDVVRELRRMTQRIPGVNTFFSNPPTVNLGARGVRSPYQYTLQAVDFDQLDDYATRLAEELKATPGFVDVNTDLDAIMPSVMLKIDRDRAAASGVTPQQIENALGFAFGGQQISQINTQNNQYQVVMELPPQFQHDPSTFSRLYVTSNTGQLVPLTAVTKVTTGSVPLTINHSGQLPSVTISFDVAKGRTLSDAVTAIKQVSETIGMPDTITGSFQGNAAAFQSSTQNMGLLLIMAMIVVYIILGVLYESFIHPLTILSGLPSAALGALLILFLFNVPLTLYAFVGMIMLIGIVKKNAIMMIDFALNKQRSEKNLSPEQAIFEAATIRFRPIMMTTMAALMGTLPIALGTGPGSDSRRPLGLCVAGGLLLSQMLTLYITPVIYTYLDRLGGRSRLVRKRPKAITPHAAPAE